MSNFLVSLSFQGDYIRILRCNGQFMRKIVLTSESKTILHKRFTGLTSFSTKKIKEKKKERKKREDRNPNEKEEK